MTEETLNEIDINGDMTDEERSADEDVDIIENEVISYVGNYSLREYYEKFNSNFIKPHFQRNNVWSPQTKSKLIESFLASYPVPPVILYKLKGVEQYWIIDGLQRISTIKEYFENEFSLIVKNEQYRGKKFKDLSKDAQDKLNNTFLNCIIVREISPRGDVFLYNLFERLNTGSTALNAMEVRRAISYGWLIKNLEELNKNGSWRKIIGKKDADNRFLDVELLLRILAIYTNFNTTTKSVDNYTGMKSFLNLFTNENKDKTFGDFNEKFEITCEKIVEQLGEFPFTLNGKKINYILLDSVMNALLYKQDLSDIKEKFDAYKSSDAFSIYDDKSGTTSKLKVNARMKSAFEAFNE